MTRKSERPELSGETAPRRHMLLSGLGVVAASAPLPDGTDAAAAPGNARPAEAEGIVTRRASFIRTKDGAEIYYKDWGTGRAIVFSHGWPLNADAWDEQIMFMAARGFRGVAFDRRGHGRSTQTWHGNDYDTFSDDLSALMTALNLRATVLVGHSAGAGNIACCIGRHGTGRVAGAVLVSAIPPLMLKKADSTTTR